MFAVIADGGRQYKVEPGMTVSLDYRDGVAPGDTVEFAILAATTGDAVAIGRPTIDGASATGTVLGHTLGKKLEIGKYKRRKNYRRHTGHRQQYTDFEITRIVVPGMEFPLPDVPAESSAGAGEPPMEAPAGPEAASPPAAGG